MVVTLLLLKSIRRVFIERVFYFYWLLYHCLFIAFNLSLYLGHFWKTVEPNETLSTSVLQSQSIIIYLLIAITGLTVLTDILPL